MATQTTQESKHAQFKGIFMSVCICMVATAIAGLFLEWQVPTISHNGMIVILPAVVVTVYMIYFKIRYC